ncbi:MAG: hypothetical protein ACE5JI_06970 [Acidobacteriota bacterium]
MGLLHNGARHGIAFGEGFLLALRRDGTAWKEHPPQLARRELPAGLLVASPVEPNLRPMSRAAQLVGEALESLGCRGGRVALVLPDLAIRAFVLRAEAVASPDALLSELATRLPYRPDDARVDVWQGPSRRTLAAAVRRAVLEQYEQVLEAVGCRATWVDAASLVLVPGWARQARAAEAAKEARGLQVHVQLYPGHYVLTVFQQGALADLRVKLRGSGEVKRVTDDLLRLPSHYDGTMEYDEITIQGDGARSVGETLPAGGFPPENVRLGEDGEESHLRNVTTVLMRRR